MRRNAFATVTIIATVAMVGALTLAAGGSAEAKVITTRVVDVGGTPVNGATCASGSDTAYSSIQDAVDASDDDDIVLVCPGTYAEEVVLNSHRVDVRGANYNVAPTGSRGAEAIVQSTGGDPAFVVLNGSTVNGFTIDSGSDPTDTGVVLHFGGAKVRDNVFVGSGQALFSTGHDELISANVFDGGDDLSTSTYTGITFSGNDDTETAGSNDTVDGNTFQGAITQAAIRVDDVTADNWPQATGLAITNNEVDLSDGAATFLEADNVSSMHVTGNVVLGNANTLGIELQGNVTDYTISGNDFQDIGTDAILFDNESGAAANGAGSIIENRFLSNHYGVYVHGIDPSALLEINNNLFENSGVDGVYEASAGTIGATDNFWGCNGGPATSGCDQVAADSGAGGRVLFDPWIVLSSQVTQSMINVGGTTTMTGDLNHDSAGNTVSWAPADTLIAQFSYPNGTVHNPIANFVGGVASTTITGTTPGTDQAIAQTGAANSTQTITVQGSTNTSLPALTIHDASAVEGNSGTHGLGFKVTMSKKATRAVTFHFTTANGSAVAGSDFVAKSGTVTIAKGKTTATITIMIKGDKAKEANEMFYVNIFNPTNARIADSVGQGTIRNDDH